MARIENIFIDNGGVMTDNARRSVPYRRLVAEYFVPRYGGTHAEWEEANANSFGPAWNRVLEREATWETHGGVERIRWLYHADWLRFLFDAKGLQAPLDDNECASIGQAAERWINPQIVTLFPGVEECIPFLASRYRLFTASDGFSASLAETLGPIAKKFQCFYGPDLVKVPKSAGRPYYEAIFSDAGVDPASSLVLDDNLSNILAACEAGAKTVYVNLLDPAHTGPTIANLAHLPEVIQQL